ncbi:MAG TPA: response regulator [Chloroflexia bacterium]
MVSNLLTDSETKTVLIVDDEDDLSHLLECVLNDAGYSTSCAHNGAEALAYMKSELPDLIVSDLMMPVMSGVELCEVMSKSDTYLHIPIIILSSVSDLKIADGCNYVGRFCKPFDLSSFLVTVESVIGH